MYIAVAVSLSPPPRFWEQFWANPTGAIQAIIASLALIAALWAYSHTQKVKNLDYIHSLETDLHANAISYEKLFFPMARYEQTVRELESHLSKLAHASQDCDRDKQRAAIESTLESFENDIQERVKQARLLWTTSERVDEPESRSHGCPRIQPSNHRTTSLTPEECQNTRHDLLRMVNSLEKLGAFTVRTGVPIGAIYTLLGYRVFQIMECHAIRDFMEHYGFDDTVKELYDLYYALMQYELANTPSFTRDAFGFSSGHGRRHVPSRFLLTAKRERAHDPKIGGQLFTDSSVQEFYNSELSKYSIRLERAILLWGSPLVTETLPKCDAYSLKATSGNTPNTILCIDSFQCHVPQGKFEDSPRKIFSSAASTSRHRISKNHIVAHTGRKFIRVDTTSHDESKTYFIRIQDKNPHPIHFLWPVVDKDEYGTFYLISESRARSIDDPFRISRADFISLDCANSLDKWGFQLQSPGYLFISRADLLAPIGWLKARRMLILGFLRTRFLLKGFSIQWKSYFHRLLN